MYIRRHLTNAGLTHLQLCLLSKPHLVSLISAMESSFIHFCTRTHTGTPPMQASPTYSCVCMHDSQLQNSNINIYHIIAAYLHACTQASHLYRPHPPTAASAVQVENCHINLAAHTQAPHVRRPHPPAAASVVQATLGRPQKDNSGAHALASSILPIP